jgi:hypothetical protein
MGRGIKPYQGGGATGGQVQVPGTRQQIKAERAKTTTTTVGEGLVNTLSGLSDTDIPKFADSLRAAVREADAGDTRAVQTYSLALSQLAQQGVDGLTQWSKIVKASGMTPKEFTAYFPQGALDAAVGGEVSAQPMPEVSREPMVSPHSWAHILGSADAAKNTYFKEQSGLENNPSLAMFPQLARYDNIRYLAQATGLPFQAVVGAPSPKGVVKQAFDMIDAARNPDGSRAVTYDFERKNQMRPAAEQMVAQEVLMDESIPAADKQRVIAMRTQELLDRMPAATYPDDLGPQLNELLMGGEPPAPIDPDAPAPVYPGSDFDPVAAQAALDNEADSLPETTDYGLGWKRDMSLDPDTNLLGSMPAQTTSPLARLIATGNENARPVFTATEDTTGLPNLQYEIGLPGYGARNLADEFAGNNASRSPLDRALEEQNAVLMGRAPTPRVVQGLLNRGGDEDLVRTIQQNLGSFYDLDNRMKDWRRGVNFQTPGGSMQFPIPPDVMAALYARQLRLKDPGIMADMVDPMTLSSDVIGSVKPSGRAASMLKAGGGFVEPLMYKVGVGGRGGVSAQQAAEIKAMLLESIQMNNQRLKDLGRTPPILFPTQPKNAPPIINMKGASLMPESSRFDNFRVNPLMRLVG